MNEDVRYYAGLIATILGVIAVWGIFYAVFGLVGAIFLTVAIGLVIGGLAGAAWYFETKRTALPARILGNGIKCSNCTHEMNIHYLINQTGDPLDGGEMMCSSMYGCECKSKWSVDVTTVPGPPEPPKVSFSRFLEAP